MRLCPRSLGGAGRWVFGWGQSYQGSVSILLGGCVACVRVGRGGQGVCAGSCLLHDAYIGMRLPWRLQAMRYNAADGRPCLGVRAAPLFY